VDGNVALVLNEANHRFWFQCGTFLELICRVDAVTQRIGGALEETRKHIELGS
jgi:hypothetical protein